MHRKKSDYTLNKLDQEAIVYIDAEGKSYRLTREDFLPEEEFLRWKKWSDENYHEMEKKQHIEDNHTVPLSTEIESMPDQETDASLPSEDEESLFLLFKDRLTDKQFRRYWLYRIENLTEEEISIRERVSHQSISKSLQAAEKIFVNFLKTRV